MPSGAPLLPLATTKVGHGEKERAYVIRQNIVLKTLLGTIVLIGSLGILVCSTTYEVHVQRRNSLVYALEHREEEHASHMRIMRLSTLLQKHLKDEVHDMSILTTYRASLMHAVGEYQARLIEKIGSNCSAAEGLLRQMGGEFDKELDQLIHKLWVDLVKEGKAAQLQLHNITAAIQRELRQDASEASDFDHLMQQAGEDPAMLEQASEHHHVHGAPFGHMHHHGHEGGDAHGAGAEQGADEPLGEGQEEHGAQDDGDDDEDHIAGALEAFFYHLQRNDSTLEVDNETMVQWTRLYDSAQRALQDEEEEADMKRINQNIAELLNHSNPAPPPFNASQYASELDYFTELMYRAKLHPYRAELLWLIGKWMDGEAPFREPLHRVEELIDQNVLQPDVLMVADSDEYADMAAEHYPYDD
ncbi:hypothetical protein AB1Y20_002155 [Prymnesium parvum]|uniref:Transmembrane protein n=1 Tax=Prymnesium parvum TaxID=97485 RepID=A0AB34J845_PRYPA